MAFVIIDIHTNIYLKLGLYLEPYLHTTLLTLQTETTVVDFQHVTCRVASAAPIYIPVCEDLQVVQITVLPSILYAAHNLHIHFPSDTTNKLCYAS